MTLATTSLPWLLDSIASRSSHFILRSTFSSTTKAYSNYARALSTNPLSTNDDRNKTGSPTTENSLSQSPSVSSLSSEPKPSSILPFTLHPLLKTLLHTFETNQQAISQQWTKVSYQWHRLANTRYGRLLRWDKPIGTHLLFLPTAWAISLTTPSILPGLDILARCYLGAFLVRGAGCAINDIWDVDIDRKVTRTKGRPIAGGEVSVTSAIVAAGLCGSGGFGLLWGMGDVALVVGAVSVAGISAYPLAKRVTGYPQVALGGVFNVGVLVGAGAASGSIGVGTLMLYGAGWCWTVVYDTIYACMDRDGDLSTKVGSMAVTLGDVDRTRKILGLWGAGMLTGLAGCGWWEGLGVPFWMGLGVVGGQVVRAIRETDLRNNEACWAAFKGAAKTNMTIWASIVAGRML